MLTHKICVAYGDGIGPEIMAAVLRILKAAAAPLEIEEVEMGERIFLQGHPTGVPEATWEAVRRCGTFLKGPMTTPQGGGYRSLNVAMRARFALFANVRPAIAYAPFIATKHPGMNLTIIRENEEDLYAGIEYQPSLEVASATKLISQAGCERIVRFAFDYARRMGRKKITAMAKDNILKFTDGLFHRVFDEIGKGFPEIAQDFLIIDIGTAKVADTPEAFDVIVLPNLYGDILSDVASQISGSVGLGGSGNFGDKIAMFEAVHGSAPKRAGQNIANPSGLFFAAVQMLVHLHLGSIASTIHNAWLKTIEEGVHTTDLHREGMSPPVGTLEFADAIIERLGKVPSKFKPIDYKPDSRPVHAPYSPPLKVAHRELVGVDCFILAHTSVDELQKRIQPVLTPSLSLQAIANRGVEVWPNGMPETFCIPEWRCRFSSRGALSHQAIASLLHRLADARLEVVRTDALYTLDGQISFSAFS